MTNLTSPQQLSELIDAWEQQQDAYVTRRADRFGIILDALSYALPEARTILDIGGGLGSFSKILLERFPETTVITLDYDPSLLELARHNLRGYGDRSVIVESDLTTRSWPDALGVTRPDAIVSSTALHWLSSAQLVTLYEQLATVLSEGGIFFNADHFSHVRSGSFFHTVSAADDARQQGAFQNGVPDWKGWWNRFRELPSFSDLIAERDRRFADGADNLTVTAILHTEALRVAGFAESGTVWQRFDDYVVYGVR